MKAAQQQRADAVWLSNVSERLPRDVEEADSKFRIGWSMADSNRRPLACQRSGRPCRAYSTGTQRDAQFACHSVQTPTMRHMSPELVVNFVVKMSQPGKVRLRRRHHARVSIHASWPSGASFMPICTTAAMLRTLMSPGVLSALENEDTTARVGATRTDNHATDANQVSILIRPRTEAIGRSDGGHSLVDATIAVYKWWSKAPPATQHWAACCLRPDAASTSMHNTPTRRRRCTQPISGGSTGMHRGRQRRPVSCAWWSVWNSAGLRRRCCW